MTNQLANETSPYLLQHAENPVDWMPWGTDALARSKDENKPIFLSIGYSACHWCHVMEHESFENEAIAKSLNERFVCVKVDREERPDLDQVYMNAVQIMTGRGGWPMSVFLTPDLEPFYGGTYWPPSRKMGMPGFDEVIMGVDDAWKNRKEMAIEQAGEMARRVQSVSAGQAAIPACEMETSLLENAGASMQRIFDFTHGGFGQAPKFPHAMDLQVLLRLWCRTGDQTSLDMVKLNLHKMAGGGIYDHLAGGFARYSVDERWLVPHFEKMLYDNALLAEVYIDAHLATREHAYAQTAKETLDYIIREMTDELGGFHSTEDADSEGVEGKFYVWSPTEVLEVLGADRGDQFCYVYDITENGNFEGQNIPNLPKTIEQCAELKQWDVDELKQQLAEDREQLRQHRETRIRPGKDDKILASWNGLMIHSMSRAAIAFDSDVYRAAAVRAAEFVWERMRTSDGRLLHSWRNGEAKFNAYLEDYSYLANAFVTLYEATFDERWVGAACDLADQMLSRFQDSEHGGFFFTASDHERLIARNKDLHDSSVPSSTAMAATSLFRLGRLTGRTNYLDAAESAFQSTGDLVAKSPAAAGQMLITLDMMLGPFREIIIAAPASSSAEPDATDLLLRTIGASYSLNQVVACRRGDQSKTSPLDSAFANRAPQDASAMVYICEQFTCQAPIRVEEAARQFAAE